MFLDGDVDRAEAGAFAALRHVAAIEYPESLAAYGLQHVGFRLHRGRGADVVDVLREAIADRPTLAGMRCGLVFALTQAGDVEAARPDFLRLVANGCAAVPIDINWSAGIVCLAEACCLMGDEAPARDLIPLLEPYPTDSW